MAVNKVEFNTENGTETLIDLTSDTVTPDTLADGVTAHDAAGEKIVGRMISGGGGSVQADWAQNDPTQPDYVKNRTHYTETETSFGEILPEQTDMPFDEEGGMGYVLAEFLLEIGQEYTVIWNGTEYNSVCQAMQEETDEGVLEVPALGDVGLMFGGESTGEPFIIILLPPEVAAEQGAYAFWVPLDGSTNPTLTIVGESTTTTVHQLELKYVPFDAIWTEKALKITVDETGASAKPNLSFETVSKMSVAQIKSIASFVWPEQSNLGVSAMIETAVTSVVKTEAVMPDGSSIIRIEFLVPSPMINAGYTAVRYRRFDWTSLDPNVLSQNSYNSGQGEVSFVDPNEYKNNMPLVTRGTEIPEMSDRIVLSHGNMFYAVMVDENGELFTERVP